MVRTWYSLDIVDFIRICFLGAAVAVLIINAIPALSSRFIAYGARSSQSVLSSAQAEKEATARPASHPHTLLDIAIAWQVPHGWFSTFYVLSTSLSIISLIVLLVTPQILTPIYELIRDDRPSVPFSRQMLGSMLLLIQGSRRLAETRSMQSSSSSTMWVGHWLMGIVFYVGMSIAICIEGTATILQHQLTVHDFELGAPSLRAFLSILLFTFASGIQHDCHAYLASLKSTGRLSTQEKTSGEKRSSLSQYRLPAHPAFSRTLTPHYLAECVIYLSLTILIAPVGSLVNWTLFCAWIFVVVNLGVTAIGTRKWYARTFGPSAVHGRWAMIPFVL